MQALIALIAASGIRLGEALALDRGDIDAVAGMLRVTGKNGHTRLLPMHPTTVAMLDAYAARRDQLCPATTCPGFFVTTTGRRVQHSGVQHTFAKLLALAHISHAPRKAPAQNPPAAPHIRGVQSGRLVPERRRRNDTTSGAVHLSWTFQPRGDVLVPAGVPATARPGRRTVGTRRPRRHRPCSRDLRTEKVMSALRAADAGILHRPFDDPEWRQPAHRDLLSGHLQIAAELPSPADRQAPRPSSI